MESGNSGASSKGVLVPVSATSDVFQNNVLAPLKSAYLYEESKQSFRYKSAVLIKNPALEKKYNAFRAKRREAGYSEEDLKESYGFLLFDDANKANALGETGVLTGNSTCTTLGDPSKGVYISMYSDCLDLNRWYHGKSGHIAIIRLTKGRDNKVIENYTQNFTAPTEGFDCHVSEQLPSVSAKTSSFLAFERTQYYMYELLDDGSNETAQSPSAACPFAIVSFSYTDTKAALVTPQEKSEEKKLVCNYFPWRGQLQIGTHFYDFRLRSTQGATIPVELPPVVKVDRAISMSDLRQLLPRAVFETCFSGEVFLDGLYCSLCELVSSVAEQTSSLSLLLHEIKEKDVALAIPLNDGGFLILLHSSHFLTYDDTGSRAAEVLQGMFVFPDSRVIQRETKFGQRKHAMSSEVLRVLPVLSYAEGEVEKTSIESSEELCEVLAQHMQSYAALINPGLALSPSRDFNIFPDQYDVPDAHKHLYLSPEWTERALQNFRSYLNKPVSFQLPVSKASEIMAAGQEERIEDLDDDVYFCPSSPEEALACHVSMASEDQLTDQKSAVNVETFVDSCITSAAAQVDLTAVPHNVVPDDLQPGDATKDTGKSDLTVLVKADNVGTKNLLTPSTSDDLPAELIVSITSAEQTVTDASLSVINTESKIKHNDFQLSGFSTAKFETVGMNSLNDETAITKKVFDCSELPSLSKTKRRKHRRRSKGRKRVSKARLEVPCLETVKIPVEDDNLKSQKEDQAKELSSYPQLSNPTKRDWRKLRGRKLKLGSSKNIKLRSATVGLAVAEDKNRPAGQQSFESTILKELEACPLRKKTMRWDLKPVISECGRILVPHGSVDIAYRIKTLKDRHQSTKDELSHEKMLVDASVNAHVTVEMEQNSSNGPETAVDETEATTSKIGGNHFQNIIVSNVDREHNILRQSDDRNGSLTLNSERSEHSSKNDGNDTPLKTVQEKHTDTSPLQKCATKGELLLNKLKSVLSRKRTTGISVSEEKTADTAQDTEPCLKKSKVDSDSEMLKINDKLTIVQDTSSGVKEVSKMPSVDPLFAYALGLTPKETPDKIQKSEGQDTKQSKDSPEPQVQTILDKQPQIIQRPLPIIPRRGRIKTLKKHQGISAEYVKKKWWLHFQTPACFASDKLKNKECTSDNSVRKTVKEKSSSACSSTDALNLLADLALSANIDQVPLQPDPAQRKPETSLKKCDLTKDVTSGEPESVLHALLRQPAARPIQPLESPKPSHLVGGSEMVGLISKEHAYSLPPSSSLLLGLSGTPFQVSPISGSTRLLHHHQTMCGGGIKTLHPSVDQEDISEHNHRTPEYLKQHMVRRRKFRLSRTFVYKDGSVQVTKQWKENYDFNLDSKFTSDSKDRAIIRALHGPWDFSIQDTSEEMRLIVHMWIGLFYSRSTARFFHFDLNLTNPISEESDSLKLSSGMISAPAHSVLKANSFAPYPNVSDTSDTLISKALDLSKKDKSVLDQGSVILDLSLRNSIAENVTSDPQVNKKETPVSGEQKEANETANMYKSSKGPRKASSVKCYSKSVHSTEITNEVNDVRSNYESGRTCTPLQKAGSLEQTNVPSTEGGGTPSQKDGSLEQTNVPSSEGGGTPLQKDGSLEQTNVPSSEGGGTPLQKDGSLEQTNVPSTEGGGTPLQKAASLEQTNVPSTEGGGTSLQKDGSLEQTNVPSTEGGGTPLQKDGSLEQTNVPSTEGGGTFISEQGECVSDQLENHLSALRTEHVLHGNYNEKTDMKDGIENSEATNMSLVQKQERDPSKSVTDKEADFSKKADNVILKTEHDENESKDWQNWEVKGKPYQEGNQELSPNMIRESDDSTNKESGVVCNGNLLENEKQLPLEEPKAVSPGKTENVNEDVDCCADHKDKVAINDYFRKDVLDEKHCCTSNVEADSNLSNQPLPMMCDGPDSVKKDCIPECKGQAPLDEQPPQANYEEDVCHDLQLRKLCANGSTLKDDHTISEIVPHAPSEVEPVQNEPADEDNSENDICLADLNYQPLPTCDGPDSVKKDCITESSHQPQLDEQPPQADNKEHAFHDLQLCANSDALTDEHTVSEIAPHSPSEMEPIHNEPVVEENSENDICLANKAHIQEAALPMSDESACLIDGSSVDGSTPQISDNVETGSQNKVMANFSPSSDDQEDQDTKSVEEEQNVDNVAHEELSYLRSHSPQCVAETRCEAEVVQTKETDVKSFISNEGLEKSRGRVLIPFIGLDISGEDASHSEGEAEEVHSQKGTSFINETTYPETALPSEVCSTSQIDKKKAVHTTGKISLSLLDVSKSNQPEVSGSESDDRCPTPTIDEEPCQYVTFSGPSGSSRSAFSGSEAFKNMPQKSPRRSLTLRKDEMLLVPKHRTTVNSDSHPHHGLHPDLELRTLRVLQSIDDFFYNSSHTDKSNQLKTADIKPSVDQPVKLQETSLEQACHSHRSFPSTECLQAIKQNIDQDRHKTASQTNLCHEPRSYSQRPVMAVKPSKSDEIQADCISKDREIENFVLSHFSKNQQTVFTHTTPTSVLLEKKTESHKGNFTGLNDDKQETPELSSKSSWLSNVSGSKSHSDLAKFPRQDPLYRYKGSDISVFNKVSSSSLPMQSFESAKTSSKLVDGGQGFLTNSSVEKVGQTFKESIEINPKDRSDASSSVDYYKDDTIMDDSFFPPPQSSLTCTVYNNSRKRSASFLEQLSQRCLQDDLTQMSMEQECLIFSEQMKQLLKRTKMGPFHQLDAHDNFNLSCSSPVTVHFSSLEEQEDSVDHMDAPSLVGLKIRVDMSDRKDLADNTEKENNLHPPKLSEGTENPMEHAGVSGVTAECARLYTAMMNDVCAVKRIPSRPGQFFGYPKTEPSNHFDFCDQMKKEMDDSFRSNLNSVVKKCCKTRYRFYILVTSDDAFFKETKAQLGAEGHTAVQPSEFFLGEDSSSSLLIILRNEDIAEHICKVPHLLELKMSPDVQFAGIDEPDDVGNLTHQELFIRGGFIMFDRAALESLSLCNMKKMSEILLELSKMGKWKWMFHYRDSRRLKETARLNAEAKEKKHFLNWCQDVGILEVLPYHECDLTSRDQPDYLTCLVRLQVQNISARYTVLITDTRTDSAFGTNGILTMTLTSFLTCSPSETFKV